MICAGLWRGERLTGWQSVGFAIAVGGLVMLVLPGVTAPSWTGALLMSAAGVAWGIYSLLGRGNVSPTETTAGNFLRATAFAAGLSLLMARSFSWDGWGAAYAVVSGAIASGLGYAIWYTTLPSMRATQAATVQLSVPVIAAVGGVVLLDEALTPRLVVCSMAILGGIALVLNARSARAAR